MVPSELIEAILAKNSNRNHLGSSVFLIKISDMYTKILIRNHLIYNNLSHCVLCRQASAMQSLFGQILNAFCYWILLTATPAPP